MKKNPEHILCIDDEPDILEIASMCLESVGGFRVTRCSSGADGLASALKEKPDIILLDVMMPTMDGPTTLSKIKAEESIADIPVVFMTARVQPAEVDKYLKLGAAAVIKKPFDPMKISDDVKAIWEKCHG